MEEAMLELGSEEGARICAPGQWVIWRENGRICMEVKA